MVVVDLGSVVVQQSTVSSGVSLVDVVVFLAVLFSVVFFMRYYEAHYHVKKARHN